MAPMRAIHLILRSQAYDRAGGTTLLTNTGVCRAMHQAFARKLKDRFFKGPDDMHGSQQRPEQGGRSTLPILLGSNKFNPGCGRM